MNMKNLAIAGGLATATLFATGASGAPINRVELGVLDCVVGSGSGFVIGSTKDVRCTYHPTDASSEEAYFGTISKFGIDIGSTDATYMKWAVLAPTSDAYSPGALAGDYYGVSAEATAGAGLGANALVGGSSETIGLQPLSVQGQTGLNFALAVSELQLRTAAD